MVHSRYSKTGNYCYHSRGDSYGVSERTWERKLKPPFTSCVTRCPSVNQFPDSLLCIRQCNGATEMVKIISQGGKQNCKQILPLRGEESCNGIQSQALGGQGLLTSVSLSVEWEDQMR